MPRAYIGRAYCSEALKDYLGAIEDYTALINFKPDICYNYLDRGKIKLKIKDKVGACEDFHKAKSLGCGDEQRKVEELIKKNCR